MIDIKEDPSIESPGEVIERYIIKGLNMGVGQLAHALNVPANRMYQIIQNKRDISVDTALRLGYFLNMDPLFWLDIQTRYKLREYKESQSALKDDIRVFKPKQPN